MPTERRYALCTTTVFSTHGIPVELIEGRAYVADDPIVVSHPHLFGLTPAVYTTRGDVVEQATAAPGERRMVRRGK